MESLRYSPHLNATGRSNLRLLPATLLLLLLLVGSSSVSGFRDQTQPPLPFNTLVARGTFQYFPLTTIAANSLVQFSVSSDNALSTALMSTPQFTSFNNSQSDLSNSLYLDNATTAQGSLREPVGTFYLVFYAYGRTANVSYNFEVYPTDPYLADPLPAPEPTGIASYGLFNQSGVVKTYEVKTSEVVGVANITSMSAYNATAGLAQSNISGATLQLNSVLLVNETGGNQQSYWIQNTPDFVTSATQVAFADNLWNFSVSGYLDNNTVTSADGGAAYTYPNGATTGYYYSYEGFNMTYTLPLEMILVLNETVKTGVGVVVGYGGLVIEGGQAAGPIDWFDTVTIHDPTAQSAYYFVTSNATAPDSLFYDTELVFGGEANGEATNFVSMNSTLGMYYASPTNGTLISFPSLYTFGGDTAEGADNLQVSYVGDGVAKVSTGSPDYIYLGTASGTLDLGNSTSVLTSASSSGTSASTGQTTSTGASSNTSSVTSSITTSTTSKPSLSGISMGYLLVMLTTASVLAALLWRGTRRVRRIPYAA